ncbi:MAG TPA: ABC transporter ATP-binding protein [Alphaproteobacteria bacterium]|nr:ABC transporter ATP-binding protein [Alphaproteobacteria bacterium]
MTAEPLLSVQMLNKHFGGIVATDNLSLDVVPGEIHAVIGPNGAGKTTLVAQLSGMLKPDGGKVIFDGHDVTSLPAPKRSKLGLARSFQITSIFRDFSVIDNVAMAIQAHSGHSFRFWRSARNDPRLLDPARAALQLVGLEARSDVISGNLAHGEQRQLEIAMALATNPKLLLLDEPMAGMGAEDSEQMTRFLVSLKGKYTMLLIEHDMDAVFRLADRITVLVYGKAIATGTPEEIRLNKEVRTAYLGEDEAA